MPSRSIAPLVGAMVTAGLVACSNPPAPTTTPAPLPVPGPSTAAPTVTPSLPPVPHVTGPLAVRVQYPSANQRIEARDSNFIFGSVGNGDAALTINGVPARVYPNGAFIGWLPVPPASAPRYDLVATIGTDTARLTLPVRVNPAPIDLALTGPLVVDSASVSPRGNMLLRDAERVRVSVRAPANASAWVVSPAGRRPLVAEGNVFATDVSASSLRGASSVVVGRDADTVRLSLGRIETLSSDTAVRLVKLGDIAADSDRFVPVRPVPSGTYKWLLFPGTILEETGRQGSSIRLKLSEGMEAWVDSSAAVPLPRGTASPRRTIGSLSVYPSQQWVDVVLPMSSRPAFLIDEHDHGITLWVYGSQATPDLVRYLGNDPLVRVISWTPEASDRVRYDIELNTQPYGFLTLFESRGFVLRLRRPPVIADRNQPLRGLTITVDPGHPPAGATGPTALYEGDAVLDVANLLKPMLEQRGATVVMTRTTRDPVDLLLRSVIARRTNSHALVSIHLNAFGDGTNPFTQNGTSTLFFHAQTEPLARAVQRGLIRQMGLRDLGVHYQNISIGRTQWMPSLITEGAFVIMPDQEAALRMPEFQARYARGILEGLEEYFRSLAR